MGLMSDELEPAAPVADTPEDHAKRRAAADDLVRLSEELGLYPEPPAADMRYEDEDPDAVARVLVRVEWANGKIREYEAEEPQDWHMNDPETDLAFRPMGMAVQAPGLRMPVPMKAAVPHLRLEFTAHPRHNMHIRTEATVAPSRRNAEARVEDERRTVRLGQEAITSGGDGEDDRGASFTEPGR